MFFVESIRRQRPDLTAVFNEKELDFLVNIASGDGVEEASAKALMSGCTESRGGEVASCLEKAAKLLLGPKR